MASLDKTEYTYSMPQNFMRDQSVPARWRLLGIINGFAINGLSFYATNEWIMNELSCSETTVSNAVKELEKLGEISIKRNGNSRVITRRLKNPDPSQLVPRPKSTGVSDPSQLVHNSDTNSDNIILITQDKPVRKFNPKGADIIKALEEIDKKNSKYYVNTAQRQACDFLIETYGLERVLAVIGGLKITNTIPYFPVITTPIQLRDRWTELESKATKYKLQKKAEKEKYQVI